MTLSRPMFPPAADRKRLSATAQVSKPAAPRGPAAAPRAARPKPSGEIPQLKASAVSDVPSGNGTQSTVPAAHSSQRNVPQENISPVAAEAASGLYAPTDLSPADVFKALGKARRAAAVEIERLIAFLDETDGDADLEPAGDELDDDADSEPSLGAPEHHPSPDSWSDDYGSPHRSAHGSQRLWGENGSRDDRELCADIEEDDSHDGREPDECDEPWLGSFDRLTNQDHGWRQTEGNARTWHLHRNDDFEQDAAP